MFNSYADDCDTLQSLHVVRFTVTGASWCCSVAQVWATSISNWHYTFEGKPDIVNGRRGQDACWTKELVHLTPSVLHDGVLPPCIVLTEITKKIMKASCFFCTLKMLP